MLRTMPCSRPAAPRAAHSPAAGKAGRPRVRRPGCWREVEGPLGHAFDGRSKAAPCSPSPALPVPCFGCFYTTYAPPPPLRLELTTSYWFSLGESTTSSECCPQWSIQRHGFGRAMSPTRHFSLGNVVLFIAEMTRLRISVKAFSKIRLWDRLATTAATPS